MNKLFDLCDTWDLTLPVYPPHSRLYALEPLGMGTPNLESLTSYLTRLAEAHSVSLRTLVIQELLPLLERDYLSNPFGNTLGSFWKEAARALNGTGLLARDWTQALEDLTLRTDLRFLTLLPWAAVLTQQRLLRITRAWCPDCFQEWQATRQPIYEPLLWNVSAVSLCPVHERPLLEQCPYPDCQATLPILASHFQPGYCSKCTRWLGVTPNSSNISLTTEQWHWQIWVAETVGELISHNMDLAVTPHLGNILPVIAASQEQVPDARLQNLAERLQLSRRTLNAWKLGTQVPQIESLIRLCYCCGISLYDLFTLQPRTFNLGELGSRSLPDISGPAKKRCPIPLDTIHIRQTLEIALACEEQPPPSMRTVAKRLDHSPRELRAHFPLLCRAISNRRKHYYEVRREQRLLQWKEEVHQAMLVLHSQGLYPSLSRILPLLSEPTALRNPIISKFRREMLQLLEWTK